MSLCPWSSQPSFVNKICAHSPLLCEIALQTKKRQLKRCFCGRCDISLHPARKIVSNAKEHSHTYYHLCCSFNYWIIWLCFSFEINSYFLGCCSPLVLGLSLSLRYESSTLILYKELSSTIFHLWVSQSVRHAWHPSKSPLFAIYKGINALYWPSIINCQLPPPHSVL